jgi:hypothetical protein
MLQDFTGLISEYVHSVMQDTVEPELKAGAARTWSSLKRSTKCGPRRTVSLTGVVGAALRGRAHCIAAASTSLQ